jgi:branched-chain amino acid transport system substrate-binding protein
MPEDRSTATPANGYQPASPVTAAAAPSRAGLLIPSGSGIASAASLGRRRFLRLAGLSGAAASLSAIAASCGTGTAQRPDRSIKLGYVSPQSGPLAAFGESDNFVLADIRTKVEDGIEVGGADWGVEIIVRDSQSSPERAKAVAEDLIDNAKVDMMLASSTPATTNPVAMLCEERGIPCLTTVTPWPAYYFASQKDPAKPKPFEWSYHFYWGPEDVMAVFISMWNQIPNNKVVGTVWSDDADGKSFRDPETGLPPLLRKAGYSISDPGLYEPENNDFSKEIKYFRDDSAEILTGAPTPPDFATFWNQTNREGYRPKIATMSKALLFPAFVEAMGPDAAGLSMAAGWDKGYPFRSSLTGATPADLAAKYSETTNRQWIQLIGFTHALFEVAIDTFKRAGTVENKEAVVTALRTTKLETVVGVLDFTTRQKDVPPNVAKTPVVGGQWRRARDYPFELVIVSNETHKEIPTAGNLEPMRFAG